MRIAFVNLPWEEQDRRGIRAGCRFPNLTRRNTNAYVPFPFLLAYAAAYAEEQGSATLCIDGVAEGSTVASVHDRIAAFAPHLVVAETSTTSHRYDLARLRELRSRCPGTSIAVYGAHTDVRPEDALASEAVDFVILGEPECTSHALACALVDRGDVSEVAGIVRRAADGSLVRHPAAPRVDLDALPYPKRLGLPMDRYHVPGFPSPVVFMYGSRGCPFRCGFCLWPQTNLRGAFRLRDGDLIAEEMAWVLEHLPETRSFFFDDDTFNLGRARLLRFADGLRRRDIRVPWGMNARADNWDRELLERLVETGLFTLRIGIESGDQDVLDRTRKGIDLEQARQTLELAHDLGIRNHVSFIIGLPGETPASVDRTIRYIKSLPVDSVQFSVAVPFPGTRMHEEAEARGHITTEDWSRYSGFDQVVMRTEAMSADDVHAAVRRARRRVYFSPRFIRRRLSYVRDIRDVGALTRKVWHLVTPRHT